MSKKVVFKFQGTDTKYTTECTACFEVPMVKCSAIDMYKHGMDSQVFVKTQGDTEVNVVMPESAKDAQTLSTMCGMGKAFCNMCQYNVAKSKLK